MGSKKVVFRLQSVSSMVILAVRTGRDSRRSTAVIRTDHKKMVFGIEIGRGGLC